MSMAGFEPASL